LLQLPHEISISVSITGFFGFILLWISCYYAWKYLNDMQYLKIMEQAEIIRKEKEEEDAEGTKGSRR
jgi:hypothetical protein